MCFNCILDFNYISFRRISQFMYSLLLVMGHFEVKCSLKMLVEKRRMACSVEVKNLEYRQLIYSKFKGKQPCNVGGMCERID